MTETTGPESKDDTADSTDDSTEMAENAETVGTTDGDGDTSAGYPWTPQSVVALRRDSTLRRVALVGAALVGLGLAWLHWLGLVLAGALLALPSRTVSRAVGAGLAFGVLVLAVFLLAGSTMRVGEFLGLQPVSYLAIAIALVAPTWGSLVRACL